MDVKIETEETEEKVSSLVPEFVRNFFRSLNSFSRIILNLCEGGEVVVEKTTKLASTVLQRQHDRIEKEIA